MEEWELLLDGNQFIYGSSANDMFDIGAFHMLSYSPLKVESFGHFMCLIFFYSSFASFGTTLCEVFLKFTFEL